MTNQEIEQAIIDNEKLVYFVVNKFFPEFRGDEDIIQVGRIGLWKACANYDNSRSKFSTFATKCIYNAIKAELSDRAKELCWSGEVVSLDEPLYFNKDGNAVTLAHLIPDPSDEYCAIDYDLSFLSGKLSERDAEVFKLSVYGFSATEIGRAFGYTRAWASRIIRKAQTLARKMMACT